MNNVLTKWTLKVGNGAETPVNPIYKDSFSLDYEHETGEEFYRCKPNGKMSLVAADASLVLGAAFDTEFMLTLYISSDMGLTWQQYHQCRFHKTDCTINLDDMKIDFQPSGHDQYDKVLAGLEKEYDLIKLEPPLTTVNIFKRSMSQIYCDGDNQVTCVYGQQSYNVKSNQEGSQAAVLAGFSLRDNIRQMQFEGGINGLVYPFVGRDENSAYYNEENIYFIQRIEWYDMQHGEVYYHTALEIVLRSTQQVHWRWEASQPQGSFPPYYPPLPTGRTSFAPIPNVESDTIYADIMVTKCYERVICDVDGFTDAGGTWVPCQALPSDDFVDTSIIYHYYAPVNRFHVEYSIRFSTSPTEWGSDPLGRYFMPPDDTGIWIPVGRNTWNHFSLWVNGTTFDWWMSLLYKKISMWHCFPLQGAIQALLKEIDASVTFEPTSTYSTFLYGSQNVVPWTGDIYITPKSNVLKGEYSEAAMKAPCTLKTILDMLKKVYKLYWYIGEDKKMHIEHISWFRNGGSYTSSPTVGYDTTTLLNTHNNKPWSFGTSEYSFDKEDMPERYTFKWMDDSSDVFDGQPVSIISGFVKEGKNEEVNVSNFTSDVDLMLLQPENFSKDGFALLVADRTQASKDVPISFVEMNGKWYEVQNPLACYQEAIRNYWCYDLPSWEAKIGTSTLQVKGIQQGRKQTLTFPIGFDTIYLYQLVKTGIGNGAFQKITFTLATGCAKVQLKFQTYDQE